MRLWVPTNVNDPCEEVIPPTPLIPSQITQSQTYLIRMENPVEEENQLAQRILEEGDNINEVQENDSSNDIPLNYHSDSDDLDEEIFPDKFDRIENNIIQSNENPIDDLYDDEVELSLQTTFLGNAIQFTPNNTKKRLFDEEEYN